MRTIRLIGTVVTALIAGAFFLPGSLSAQNLTQVYTVQPVQGEAESLEAALETHAEWRAENGDPWEWNVYQVVQGENAGAYVIRSPGHSWSDLDEYDRGFGPKGGAHFNRTVAPLMADISSSITRMDTALSRWPEDLSGYPLFEVITYHVKPGKGEAFADAFRQAKKAVVQEDYPAHFALVRPLVGTKGGVVYEVLPHQGWADFAEPEQSFEELLRSVYGQDKTAELFDQFLGSISGSSSMVVRYRPELSVSSTQ